jgi:hypothetical protein
LGEVVETEMAVYMHDPDEADDVAEDLRDGIRDMVAFVLEPDVLVCILGTVVCLRVVEAAFLQLCDFLWDHDAAFHAMYIRTVAVLVNRRKQDTSRKGLYARVGLAFDGQGTGTSYVPPVRSRPGQRGAQLHGAD